MPTQLQEIANLGNKLQKAYNTIKEQQKIIDKQRKLIEKLLK